MRRQFFSILFICLLPLVVSASDDNILDIQADKIVVNRIENIVWFYGNVRLEFEEMFLKTETIKVELPGNDEKPSLNKIKSIYIPHRLKAVLANGAGVIIADSASYDAAKSLLIFTGNVSSEYMGRVTITDTLELVATPQF